MLKKFFLLFIIKYFSLLPSFAQPKTIIGIVKEAETMQPLQFCNISILETKLGTATNAAGYFKLNLDQNSTITLISISLVGYITDTFQINTEKSSNEFFLKPMQGTLNEVIVTAVSRGTTIRESPVAIMSVSSKAIDQTTESNIIDVIVKNVAGLHAVKTGPNISKPFIRGLGYNRVLTLYDGIRQEGQQWGDEHGIEVDAYNINRAEVVKGPASIMYGSDAIAGVVSLIPQMPSITMKELRGKFTTEYQLNNGLVGNGIRLYQSNKLWAWGINGSYRIAKNYTNNIEGRVYNTSFRETNVSATVQHTSSNGYSNINATLYNNLQGIPDGSRDSSTRKFTIQIFEGQNDDIKNRPLVSEAQLNSYRLSPMHQHIQHYRIYTNNHYRFGNSDIDFSFAFQQNIRKEYTHPTEPKNAGLNVKLNTYNYSVKYNTPKFLNTDFTLGINGMYQNNRNKNATEFPIPNFNLFDIGSFIFANWKQRNWTISGGIRYDIRRLSGDDLYKKSDFNTGFSYQVFLPDTLGSQLQFSSFNKVFNGITFSIGTTYKLNENINLKANVAKGYRAPSITEFASNGLDPGAHIVYIGNRNFDPEFNLQEDIGIDFNSKEVTATISLFNNQINNYIYLSQWTDANGNEVIDAQGNKTFQYEQSKAQLYGTELLLNIHPKSIQGFSFNNSFSIVYGFNRKERFKNAEINGEYLPLIPPANLLSSVQQIIKTKSKIVERVEGKIEAEYNAAQNRYLALSNTEKATPSFTLFNISVVTKLKVKTNHSFHLQLQINNLFDKAYQSNLSRLRYFEYYNQSPNGQLGMFNMGRNICIKGIIGF